MKKNFAIIIITVVLRMKKFYSVHKCAPFEVPKISKLNKNNQHIVTLHFAFVI
jgi:hypothetical protein